MAITPSDGQVRASVLVGSVNGGEWIHVLLDALERQTGDVPFEVIVADRCSDGTAERIEREHPTVQVLRAHSRATLPVLRTQAYEKARGEYIFVTEDHTVPPADWIARFVAALDEAPSEVAAVGGLVDNEMRERTVDWAAFLCEYSGFLPPQESGEVDDAPGMNVAYRREVLDATDPLELSRAFWESNVHPRLREQGRKFLRLADVVMGHRKRFGFNYFMSQRFHYSRYYAGERFPDGARSQRLMYSALSAALPPLVLSRMMRGTLARPEYRAEALRALPALSCFALAWGVGEAVGYAFGPGDSLRQIE